MIAVSTDGKAVTISLLDKSLFLKHVGFVTLFPLMCLRKLEETFFDGVIQCLSSLHFIPELVMFAQNRSFVPKYDYVAVSVFGG